MSSCTINIRLKPRSKREGIVSASADLVEVAVNAPPVDGKANEAMIRLLAGVLGVPKSSITLFRGAASRNKVVAITGLEAASALARLRQHTG